MVEKTAAFRQRRAADTARWRERLHRGAAVYPVEDSCDEARTKSEIWAICHDQDHRPAARKAVATPPQARRQLRALRALR